METDEPNSDSKDQANKDKEPKDDNEYYNELNKDPLIDDNDQNAN